VVTRNDARDDMVVGFNRRFAKYWTFFEQMVSRRNKSNITSSHSIAWKCRSRPGAASRSDDALFGQDMG